jgi:hypothetical protein
MTEEQKARDATRYVVLALPSMDIIADQHAPSSYATEGEARKVAEAEARSNPGVDYGIFQKVLVARAELTVETKGVCA